MTGFKQSNGLRFTAVGVLAGFSMAGLQGCDPDGGGLGGLAEQCGLTCPADGILEGNASISGIASLDAFFGAVLDVKASAANVRGSVRAELDAIALSLGLERGAAVADIKAALDAKISGAVQGGLTIDYEPAKCEASVEVTAQAAAECDAEVDPGSVEVKCEGACEVDASAMVDCGAEADLVCEFTPPDLQCSGTCEGTCRLDSPGTCEGTCRGECMGGDCAGACRGECELSVSATCEGSCEGTCTVTNPEGGCEANATAKCDAHAGASVECDAQCEGSAEPPMVKAECEASVEAKANASVQCTPPSLQINFEWSAEFEGNAQAQAEFRAWLEGFKGHFAALVAASAKAELVLESGQIMIEAAGSVVGDVAAELEGDANLKAAIGANCAVGELKAVGTVLQESVDDMQFSVGAFAEISASVGG